MNCHGILNRFIMNCHGAAWNFRRNLENLLTGRIPVRHVKVNKSNLMRMFYHKFCFFDDIKRY